MKIFQTQEGGPMDPRRRMAPRKRSDSPQKRPRGGEEKDGTAARAELPYQPGISPGDVDITGIVPEGVRIEPEITEGHQGYEESGSSDIIPPGSWAGGGREPTKSGS
jgi:hypothetical protein